MTKTTKSKLITVTMAIGILSIGVLIGFSANLQPAEGGPAVIPVVTALIANLLNTMIGQFSQAEVLQMQIDGKANAIFGLETDTDFGLDAIDNQVEQNTALLTDSDFGLDAQTNNPAYGLKRTASDIQDDDFGLEEIDDEVEHNTALLEDNDFGLDAQTNNPDYGLKRTASDIQDDDWGLEVIDDEIEVMDAKISKQLAKQRVEISIIESDQIYLQTSESGKAVEVEFVSMQLISDGNVVASLNPDNHIASIDGVTGLYIMDPDKIDDLDDIDGIYLQFQHPEEPIIHPSIAPIDVDHFGSVLIAEDIEDIATQ